MARELSLTQDEAETAEDMLFLLADEAAAQRRHSACPDDMPSRMAQICEESRRAQRCTTVKARGGALALVACRALEAMLREGEPGRLIMETLKTGAMEGE